MQRPYQFTIDPYHHLANGLVFAGLATNAGSTHYHDAGSYRKHGTLANMETSAYWVSRGGRLGVSTDGTNEYVGIPLPTMNVDSNVTLAAWVWAPSGAMVSDKYIVSLGNSGIYATSLSFAYQSATADTARTFIRNDASASANLYDLATTNVYEEKLQHWCYVGTTTSYRAMFVDGKLIDEDTTSLANITINGINIGRLLRSSPGAYSKGEFFDVCLWNRPLANAEIQNLADPSNVMLSGLINYPRRKWWPVSSGATFQSAWASNATQVAV